MTSLNSDISLEAGFIEGESGRLFYVLHPSSMQSPRGCVLFVPPFAEEMNKARRMVALQARRLVGAGYAVLIPDLFGCGDSDGDFAQATWQGWCADVTRCADWLRQRGFPAPILWGLRAGCLLITDVLNRHSLEASGCLFWQPVINGELYLNQFLRLRTAADMLSGQRNTLAELRQCLARGEMLDVAGYELSPKLFNGLSAARLTAQTNLATRWVDICIDLASDLALPTAKIIDEWRGQGIDIQVERVAGEPFWATQEIIELPPLIDITDRLIETLPHE